MDLDLIGRTAIVSGGSKGIGRAIASRLLDEGATVVIAARGAEALAVTVEELAASGAGARVIPVVADMTVPAGIESVVAVARERTQRIDIAISNVYPSHTSGFDATDDAAYLREFEQMVLSTVRLTRAVLPSMRENGYGRLVNLGGLSMKGPLPGLPLILSDITRPAAVGLQKSLSRTLAVDGITVNNIAVGFTRTERLRASYEARESNRGLPWPELEKVRVAELGIPAGRLGTPEEIAALVSYLASPLAGYVTGQTISVDGGLTGGLY